MIGARYFNWAVLSAFSDTVSLVLGYVGVVVFSIFTKDTIIIPIKAAITYGVRDDKLRFVVAPTTAKPMKNASVPTNAGMTTSNTLYRNDIKVNVRPFNAL